MNPIKREFEKALEPIEDNTDARGWRVFSIGEVFELNGVKMVVRKITKKDLVLRPYRQ